MNPDTGLTSQQEEQLQVVARHLIGCTSPTISGGVMPLKQAKDLVELLVATNTPGFANSVWPNNVSAIKYLRQTIENMPSLTRLQNDAALLGYRLVKREDR